MRNIIQRTYEGVSVSFTSDAWFNATVPAKRFGKKPAKWLELPGTQGYMAALAKALGFDVRFSDIKLVRTSRVRGQSGTWLHPKLAVVFSRWLSDDFAVWCDLQIDDIIRAAVRQPHPTLSTVRDREPLLLDAILMMTRHRISLPYVYRGLAHFAGVDRFRRMTCDQVAAAHGFATRLLTGQDTGADWRQLESNRARLNAGQLTIDLAPGHFLVGSGHV